MKLAEIFEFGSSLSTRLLRLLAASSYAIIYFAPSVSYAVIGGSAPSAAVRASTVSIVSDYRGEPNSICSGTLISNDLVVTAAHCFSKLEFGSTGHIVISFGEKPADDFSGPLIREVEQIGRRKQILLYPGYVHSKTRPTDLLVGDIALIKLKTSAPAWFRPAPIANAAKHLKKGDRLLLAGFGTRENQGSSEGLFEASVPFISVGREFVVADQSHGTGACEGDSGGPAYIVVHKGLAVVSSTRGPDEQVEEYVCDVRASYTDLYAYRRFITEGARKLRAAEPIFLDP